MHQLPMVTTAETNQLMLVAFYKIIVHRICLPAKNLAYVYSMQENTIIHCHGESDVVAYKQTYAMKDDNKLCKKN